MNKPKSGSNSAATVAAILVGFIFGVVYYVFYAVVFVFAIGVTNKHVDQLAQAVCLVLGMFTAFRLMIKSPPKADSPEEKTHLDA